LLLYNKELFGRRKLPFNSIHNSHVGPAAAVGVLAPAGEHQPGPLASAGAVALPFGGAPARAETRLRIFIYGCESTAHGINKINKYVLNILQYYYKCMCVKN
jgi:hypothetical protein